MSKKSMVGIYRDWSKNYDLYANIFGLIGYRMGEYRRKATASLNLEQGDTVVDLACGTGLNLPYLQEAVGPNGRIIGVDITDAMLEEAMTKVERNRWENVELVNSDVRDYRFPKEVNGVFSSYALGYLQDYDSLIKRIYDALPVNGRFAELSFKLPESKVVALGLIAVLHSFYSKGDDSYEKLSRRRIWESVMGHFDETNFEELALGTTYIVTGTKTGKK